MCCGVCVVDVVVDVVDVRVVVVDTPPIFKRVVVVIVVVVFSSDAEGVRVRFLYWLPTLICGDTPSTTSRHWGE